MKLMPFLKAICHLPFAICQRQKAKGGLRLLAGPPIRSSLFRAKEGFAFIEIFLGLLIFGVIVIMLSSASGSVFTRRAVDQDAVASKVASREIEKARNLTFKSVFTTFSPSPSCDQSIPEVKDLPTCRYTWTVYEWSTANNTCSSTVVNSANTNTSTATLRCLSVGVSWTNTNGQTLAKTMDTLIYNDAGTNNAGL